MFTRAQRNRLQDLSLQVLGAETAYVKLLKDPQFQVLENVKEVFEPFYYDSVNEINSRTGKRSDRVVRKLYPTDKPIPKKLIPVYREMTFDELESALIAASEMKGFQAINEIDTKNGSSVLYETLVTRYRDGTIINKPYLFVPEADRPEFDVSFEMLPQEQKDVLKPYVVPNSPKNGSFVVDGVKFVDELVFQNSNHSE